MTSQENMLSQLASSALISFIFMSLIDWSLESHAPLTYHMLWKPEQLWFFVWLAALINLVQVICRFWSTMLFHDMNNNDTVAGVASPSRETCPVPRRSARILQRKLSNLLAPENLEQWVAPAGVLKVKFCGHILHSCSVPTGFQLTELVGQLNESSGKMSLYKDENCLRICLGDIELTVVYRNLDEECENCDENSECEQQDECDQGIQDAIDEEESSESSESSSESSESSSESSDDESSENVDEDGSSTTSSNAYLEASE